jgi:hypothetical protein
MATEKPKKYNHQPGPDKITAERRAMHSEIQKLINSIWNREERTMQ